jgi:phage-related protein
MFGKHFFDFYLEQNSNVQRKIDWTIGVIRDLDQIPEVYFRHLVGTELYEIRVRQRSDIYRVFCFFDQGDTIVLINGFRKKTRKTPRRELQRAKRLQRLYHEEKED